MLGTKPFDIFCHMNPNDEYFTDKGLRSSDLSFKVKKNSSWETLPSQIINETTIKASYDPSEAAKRRVECVVDINGVERSICTQTISVGCKF